MGISWCYVLLEPQRCQVNGRRLQELEAIELQHLDRVVLGRSVSLGDDDGTTERWDDGSCGHPSMIPCPQGHRKKKKH